MTVTNSGRLGAALFALASLACTEAGGAASSPSLEPISEEPAPVSTATDPSSERLRVLVTGFNDWKELGDPPNVWRCRDNPSCRLLVGDVLDAQPSDYAGPLAARLRVAAPAVEWRFATMPVTWEVFESVPRDVDLIINLGLGVYDRFDALQLEAGAYNLRRGSDAVGQEAEASISAQAEQVLAAPRGSAIAERIEALVGREIAGYEVTVAEARESNSYLCNETHFRALSAVHEELDAGGRLREVYFVHIPYARENDYEALADGVAGLVMGLLDGRADAPPSEGSARRAQK